MYDWLTKSKFYTKCKSLIRMTKTRVEVFKRKKKAVVKFLKNDMADLLKAGFDYNAYGRAEGLLVEVNVLACYDFIEQFCGCITSNLSVMDKQKGCPEECKEAVQSLIYAAARFAEFPELRVLRSLLADRYGTLELFINKEFVEKLKRKPATKVMKLQLMHDIANEFSVQWSSKSLEQKLFTPQEAQQHALPERDVLADISKDDDDIDYDRLKKIKDDVVPKFSYQDIDDDRLKGKYRKDDAYTRKESYEAGIVVNDKEDRIVQSKNEKECGFFVSKKRIDERYNLPSCSEDETSSRHTRDSSDLDSLRASTSSMGNVSEDEEDNIKKNFSYRFIPPPYFKPKVDKQENKAEVPLNLADNIGAERVIQPDDAGERKPKPRSVRTRPLKPPPDTGDHGVESLLKPTQGHEKVGIAEILASLRKSSIGKQEADSADQGNGEEKMLDGLLKQHGKKDSPCMVLSREDSNGTSEVKATRIAKSELPSLTSGAPYSQEPPTPSDAMKGHGRASSLQPGTLRGHVHPNLPDYEELAARIAALRGR